MKTRPNRTRVVSGLLLLLLAVAYVYRLNTDPEYFALGKVVLVLLPTLSGLLLIIVTFWRKLQDSAVEYVSWALSLGALGLIFYRVSVWVQWGVALAAILACYGIQHLKGQPLSRFGYRHDPLHLIGPSMHLAAWIMGERQTENGKYKDPEIQDVIESAEGLKSEE